ncbi:hypothetical protein SISSUDRAFT_519442 [Sistotremastrum suecicum HHB10207 ss-3]|uniref:Uncharacterized protein n=1 Tax=Sistotremastrum suecicum HHB10207 ss-3 TaxID=1314776 RepID=A0A166FA00_9AGAM|nr:hypothetical protein SISSUDRAFT_519442 [Sistotremastrum suecicum HHB10207 ss-3]
MPNVSSSPSQQTVPTPTVASAPDAPGIPQGSQSSDAALPPGNDADDFDRVLALPDTPPGPPSADTGNSPSVSPRRASSRVTASLKRQKTSSDLTDDDTPDPVDSPTTKGKQKRRRNEVKAPRAVPSFASSAQLASSLNNDPAYVATRVDGLRNELLPQITLAASSQRQLDRQLKSLQAQITAELVSFNDSSSSMRRDISAVSATQSSLLTSVAAIRAALDDRPTATSSVAGSFDELRVQLDALQSSVALLTGAGLTASVQTTLAHNALHMPVLEPLAQAPTVEIAAPLPEVPIAAPNVFANEVPDAIPPPGVAAATVGTATLPPAAATSPPHPPIADPVPALAAPTTVPAVGDAEAQPNGLIIGPYPWTGNARGAYTTYKQMVGHLPPHIRTLATQSVPVRITDDPLYISANLAGVPGGAAQVANAWTRHIGGARRDSRGVSFIPVVAAAPPAVAAAPPLTADQAAALFEAAQAL